MKTNDDIVETLVRIQRQSMRTCALEYRRASVRGGQGAPETWLTFAKYHRDMTKVMLGNGVMNSVLESKVNALVRQMATRLGDFS